MNKFYVLLKKEIRELLTPYTFLPLIITVIIFALLGKIVSSETDKLKAPQNLIVLDQDQTAISKGIQETLTKSNFKVNTVDLSQEAALQETKQRKFKALLVIPEGFEASLTSGKPKKLITYNILSNFSMVGTQGGQTLKAALAALNVPANPILTNDHVVVKDRQAAVSLDQVMGFVSSQSYFIPIILFIIIIFAAQMIATSIASEKENKTLETLLSSPVSRKYIVSAKLLSAGLVALLFASVYVFSMRYYMNGVSGGALGANLSETAKQAINQLGLSFNTPDYIALGISLFFGILSALAIALILGAFAEDVKGVQSVITPLMVLVIIPYFLVMFLDFTTLPKYALWLIYAIPFSHPFLAVQNLLLHNYWPVIYGVIYQAVVFLIFVYLASWIFASDQILTLKLGKRKTT